LLSAIANVSRGDYVIHLSIAGQVVQDYITAVDQPGSKHTHEDLSQREREILDLVAQGFRTREIADRLGIAAQTVSGHRANIMKKLGVHGQTEMVKYAILRRLTRVGGIEGSTQDTAKFS
jgi:two-component system response regulator NreC